MITRQGQCPDCGQPSRKTGPYCLRCRNAHVCRTCNNFRLRRLPGRVCLECQEALSHRVLAGQQRQIADPQAPVRIACYTARASQGVGLFEEQGYAGSL